jgi:DNA-directed RNA polymerase specialized sigma subunit
MKTSFDEHTEVEREKTILLQNILKEIEKLPQHRRAILHIYFFGQKTTNEIVEIMQLNKKTLLYHRAKALGSLEKPRYSGPNAGCQKSET